MNANPSTHLPIRGLYAVKPAFRQHLAGVAELCIRYPVHPDVLTYAAVACAAIAGLAILISPTHPLVLLAVAPLVLARLALNALDGMVAESTGLARPWGKVLNEGCDRLSDLLCLAPLALLPGAFLPWCVAAIVTSLGTAYVRTLAEAAGAGRQYGGIMGKADRMLWLAAAAIVAALGQPVVLVALPVLISLGAAATMVQRLRNTHAGL